MTNTVEKEPLSWRAREYLGTTPLHLLEATRDPPQDRDLPVLPSEVLFAALHGIARIMLADGAEQMLLVSEEVRRELVIEFYDRVQ
jgi:hypothetical protein